MTEKGPYQTPALRRDFAYTLSIPGGEVILRVVLAPDTNDEDREFAEGLLRMFEERANKGSS